MTHSYANTYGLLVQAQPQLVAETKYPYETMTERHVQVMWYEQKYLKRMFTSEGEPIDVLSPGIWNGEAGPDFLKAHLVIGGEEV